jgi:transcriptional regulator GlxA family with amidase domain
MRSVGAQLQPGAAEALLGVSASELAERHTPLVELWGRAAHEVRERLLETAHLERRLEVFESLLAARLPKVRGVHPVVAHALARFAATTDVRKIVEESGYSHRRFIALFRQAVGLTPKLYSRVLRFQGALERTAAKSDASWVDLALETGYSDQSHFNREFREFAGLPPGEYRRISPAWTHHVPIGAMD